MDQKVERYVKLLQVGQIITSEMNFDVLFPLVIQHTNSIMNAEASYVESDLKRPIFTSFHAAASAGMAIFALLRQKSARVPIVFHTAYPGGSEIVARSVAVELSNFKCGHDAPIYGVIEGIIEQSGTPYFCFKDLDENKPSGSIKIRVETIDYFLRRYREEIIRKRKAAEDIEAQLATFEERLRSETGGSEFVGGQSSWKPAAHEMAAD